MFYSVVTPLLQNLGQLFSSPSATANTACMASLGHNCVTNSIGKSGTFVGTATSFLVNFAGKIVASASAASSNPALTAGIGKI